MLKDIQLALGYILGYLAIVFCILFVIKGIHWAGTGIFW